MQTDKVISLIKKRKFCAIISQVGFNKDAGREDIFGTNKPTLSMENLSISTEGKI